MIKCDHDCHDGGLAGAYGPTSLAEWVALRSDLLTGLLELPHRAPHKDVFRRARSALKPDEFQMCFANWLNSKSAQVNNSTAQTRHVFTGDGKALRWNADPAKGLAPLHSVAVWASDYGITLADVAINVKSNEITAIPEVLKRLNEVGTIVTIDALGTQIAIAKQIVGGSRDFVMALIREPGNFPSKYDRLCESTVRK